MKRNRIILAGLCAVMLTASFAAAEENASPDAAAQEVKTLGTKEEDAFEVVLKNSTGREISSVMIRSLEEEEYSLELLEGGEVFAADEERVLYYKPSEKAEKEENAEQASEAPAGEAENMDEDKAMPEGYDLQLTFAAAPEGGEAEDAVCEIHSFPFEDMDKGELFLEEDVAYLKYTSIVSGQEISTLEYEKNIKVQEDAAAAGSGQKVRDWGDQPVAYVAEPAPVYTDNSADYTYNDSDYGYDSSYSDYSYSDYSYDDYSYDDYSYDDYSYTEPSGGSEDNCIEDGLFY